jgi:hypothetical protein
MEIKKAGSSSAVKSTCCYNFTDLIGYGFSKFWILTRHSRALAKAEASRSAASVSPLAEMMLAVFTCSAFSTRNLAHKRKSCVNVMAFNSAPTCLPYAFYIYKFRILCDVSYTEYRHHVNIGKLKFFCYSE